MASGEAPLSEASASICPLRSPSHAYLRRKRPRRAGRGRGRCPRIETARAVEVGDAATGCLYGTPSGYGLGPAERQRVIAGANSYSVGGARLPHATVTALFAAEACTTTK